MQRSVGNLCVVQSFVAENRCVGQRWIAVIRCVVRRYIEHRGGNCSPVVPERKKKQMSETMISREDVKVRNVTHDVISIQNWFSSFWFKVWFLNAGIKVLFSPEAYLWLDPKFFSSKFILFYHVEIPSSLLALKSSNEFTLPILMQILQTCHLKLNHKIFDQFIF